MPTSRKSVPSKKSAAIAPKPKKHVPPPPPPPGEHPHHEPGRKHPKKGKDKPAGKHLRRAYEHLGRVEILQGLATPNSVSTLARLAQATLDRGKARPAADLLRAAEHLSFASAAAKSRSGRALSPDLEEAVRREFRELLEEAEDHHLTRHSDLADLLHQTLEDARSAFDDGSFRQALELARAAEALASIEPRDADRLDKLKDLAAPLSPEAN